MDAVTHDQLAVLWFVLLGILLSGYLVLDGFDLGVGILHLLVPRNETERRLSMNSIGPFWDGNEVWLVTLGGALFAMFPFGYAVAFPAFYTAFMLMLFAFIFRAVSLEFRGKMSSKLAQRAWDFGFFMGSLLASFLFGVLGGNVIAGLNLDLRGHYTGSIVKQLRPYGIATGTLMVSMMALHGALFLHRKVSGDFQRRVARAAAVGWWVFVAAHVVVTIWTIGWVPRATENLAIRPALWAIPVVNSVAILATGWLIWRGRTLAAFFCNAVSIISLVAILASALFPNLIHATDPAADLRLVDAASSRRTLIIGLIVVAIGIPFVLTYTTIIYWTFRGKTKLESHSY